MELVTIQDLLNEPAKLIDKVISTRDTSDDSWKQYQPENHAVTDESIRKKREVKYDSGEKDENGNLKLDENGDPLTKSVYEEVARITTAAQKQIVEWAVQIAAGVPVELDAKPEKGNQQIMFEMVRKTLKDNKLEYQDQEILRLRAIYKVVAEIWYSEECDPKYWGNLGNTGSKFKMRMKILSEETGDLLYPIRDNVGDMIALGRSYKVLDEAGKDVEMFDLFMKDAYKIFTKTVSGWVVETKPIKYGKANFIVHEQARREWQDVQNKIDRLETLDSNHADQNDATGSPIIVGSGVKGMGKRGETGKMFDVENGGKLEILEAAGAPESMNNERENLVKGIFDETNTPQISFSEAQGFGANVPGITIKLLFLPATLKALSKQSGGWGMSIQRRINFLMAAMVVINTKIADAISLEISPRFQIYMPENTTEKYDNVIKLYAAGLISMKTAIAMIGIVDDVDEEIAAIEAAAEKKNKAALELAQKSKPVEPTPAK
jgi:SPP1 family phage portal protein